MNLAVLVYDFPHRRSQDFLLRLWLSGYSIASILGTPWRHLGHSAAPLFRVKPRHRGFVDPQVVAARLGAPYFSVEHSSPEAARIVREHDVDVVVIAGARIIKGEMLTAPRVGTINLHPGLIPHVRGLDALKWAVHDGFPAGVTAHFIDERVDAGRIIERRELDVYDDDTWVDLSLRLEELELEMLPEVLARVAAQPRPSEYEVVGEGRYNRTMPAELERETLGRFEDWKGKFSQSRP